MVVLVLLDARAGHAQLGQRRGLSQTCEAALARMQQVITLSLSLSNLAVVQADRNNWQSAVVSNVPAQPCLSPSAAAGNRSLAQRALFMFHGPL